MTIRECQARTGTGGHDGSKGPYVVGDVSTEDGTDLEAEIVRAGLALTEWKVVSSVGELESKGAQAMSQAQRYG